MRHPETIIQSFPEIGLQANPYQAMDLNSINKKLLIETNQIPLPKLIKIIVNSSGGAYDFEKVEIIRKIWSHVYVMAQDSIYVLNLYFAENSQTK